LLPFSTSSTLEKPDDTSCGSVPACGAGAGVAAGAAPGAA
jgi:hypothetical protein